MSAVLTHVGPVSGRASRLPLSLQVGYGLGQLIDGVVSNTLNVFLLFYLTAVCGLPGAAAGLALSVGLVVDAAADPLIGSLSDGWRSRWGRRLPFMAAGFVPAAIAFVAIFSLPRGLPGGELLALVVVLSVLLRCSSSVFNLPYLALGAEVTDDHGERVRVAAWRWGIGMATGLVCILLGFGVFLAGPNGLMNRDAYRPFAFACTALMALGAAAALISGHMLRGRTHTSAVLAEPAQRRRFFREMGELFRNASFRVLFVSAVLFFVSMGLSLSLGLHANTFFWRLDAGQIKLVTLSQFVGLLVGAPLTTPLAIRLEKRTAMLIGAGGLVLALSLLPTLRLSGLLPLSGQPLALLLSGVAAIGGVMLSMAGVAFGAMMADAADEHEFLFRARREGLYFAGWAFSAKASQGVGALIAGLVLQFIGLPSNLNSLGGLHAHLSPVTVELLGLFVGPGAAVIGVAGMAMMLGYGLDRRRHADILSRLSERRP